MTLLRRPAPRFVLWAILLVGVAAIAGVAGLSPWAIVGVEFVAWVVVAVTERRLSGPWTSRPAPSASPPANAGEETFEPLPSNGYEPEPEPLPEPEPAAAAATVVAAPQEPAPRRRASSWRAPAPPPEPAKQWNVWTLEELVREEEPPREELVYLVASLREYADSSGTLPAGFDQLVRESFGPLLSRAG